MDEKEVVLDRHSIIWRAKCKECNIIDDRKIISLFVEYTDEDNARCWALMHQDVTGHETVVKRMMHKNMDVYPKESTFFIDPEVFHEVIAHTEWRGKW